MGPLPCGTSVTLEPSPSGTVPLWNQPPLAPSHLGTTALRPRPPPVPFPSRTRVPRADERGQGGTRP
jgi:hypothetical protein